ncbi:dipeptidase [Mucilaginibacter gotjawali]|uniref:Microsomal dipeptidase-like Zn-dependent dipeptidase n=2 Tax=Mucilaginibacter gotjawali TaxID=1550579 RepID=A0A839SEB6_9SPHI|nr:membrane dipeptidase [Mucilaginibacter gotjawali]MBB3056581.1 microsomal dipeptidase-like Zn-dependent dipeptidase [Mucilaginibacter gotjawali]BAU52715.1 membrane dipeptidase [Mucilaginibacter gotjawali]
MKFQSNWSRRAFLSTIGIAGAGTALAQLPLAAWALDGIDPGVAAIVAATIGVDTHNHIDVPLIAAEVPGPRIELAREMKISGLSAICMTFALDYQKLQNPGEAYERFLNGLDAMDQQLAANGMKRSLNMADLRTAHDQRQPTVIQSVEGGHFLEGRLERVEAAYKRGLRHLGLLHDSDASVPLGDVYTNPPRYGGLTSFGADVIRECNRLGILVDLAHASKETIAAALKVAAHPVIISHTGLDTQLGNNEGMARMMRPRLISKEQAKIVAGAGGVIGVWTHLADSPLAYAQNVRALVDVIGIDHVCIGTDTKLTPAYRSPGRLSPKPSAPPPPPGGEPADHRDGPPMDKDHIGPGGGQSGARTGERTNQAWQDQQKGFYYLVVDALLKTGFTADEIGKAGGGNFCRVFDAATAALR